MPSTLLSRPRCPPTLLLSHRCHRCRADDGWQTKLLVTGAASLSGTPTNLGSSAGGKQQFPNIQYTQADADGGEQYPVNYPNAALHLSADSIATFGGLEVEDGGIVCTHASVLTSSGPLNLRRGPLVMGGYSKTIVQGGLSGACTVNVRLERAAQLADLARLACARTQAVVRTRLRAIACTCC